MQETNLSNHDLVCIMAAIIYQGMLQPNAVDAVERAKHVMRVVETG